MQFEKLPDNQIDLSSPPASSPVEASQVGLADYSDDELLEYEVASRSYCTTIRCGTCNRDEVHVLLPSRERYTFGLTVLITLGLVYFFGPFQCVCCGNRRLFRYSNKHVPARLSSKRLMRQLDVEREWRSVKRRDKRIKFLGSLTKPLRNLFKRRDFHF